MNNIKILKKIPSIKKVVIVPYPGTEIEKKNELNLRKRNNLPPYERFIALILSSSNEKKLDIDAVKLKNILSKSIDAKILGPVNAPIYRINQKFRNRLLIRAKKTSSVQKKLKDVLKDFQLSKGMKLSVDVDPISFN